MNSLENVNLTVQQAVAFLTSPLLDAQTPPVAVDHLQRALTSSLVTRYSATGQWDIRHPDVGSESRAIRISTACPPPTYIARACEASGIQWSQWLFLLGGGHGVDLDLFVDPGRVSVCFRKHGSSASDLVTVWRMAEPRRPSLTTRELLAMDNDDTEIFALIDQKVNSPSWVSSWSKSSTPTKTAESSITSLKVPKISPVPGNRSHLKVHSRSSSSSSIFSGSSHSSSAGSPPKTTYCNSSGDEETSAHWRQQRSGASDTSSVAGDASRNKTRPPVVVVDTAKATVTTHDGGKTVVVGGGVMLGGGNKRRR